MTQTKKKTNKLATIFIATILAILILLPAAAMFNTTSAYYLLGWDLVDNGKHLDWDGGTKYLDDWYDSVQVWEDYKPGVIRKDSIS